MAIRRADGIFPWGLCGRFQAASDVDHIRPKASKLSGRSRYRIAQFPERFLAVIAVADAVIPIDLARVRV